MYTSKLVDVFYALSKFQVRSLRKFVKSPFYNKRKDVIDLFELMFKTPLENRTALRKENAYPVIYEKSTYNADKLDYVMSFLFKLIEQFLVQEHNLMDKTKTQVTLMEVYSKLGLSKHFKQTLNLAEKRQEQNPLRDVSYHEKAFSIELQKSQFLSSQQRDASKNLQELSNKLDLRFLAHKLKDACRLLAHQAVAKQKYNFGLLDNVLTYIDTKPELLNHTYIASYYYYYQALIDEKKEEQHFQKFKKIFLNSTQSFEDEELQDLYTMALNFCVKKLNLGQQKYEEELFEIYNAGLRLRILVINGKLNQFKFNNITKLALRLGKTEWCEQFLKNYKDFVDEQFHGTYVHNAYSMLYFAQGKYKETMTRLQQIDYKELFITMDAKVLLVKVYFQLKEFDVLESFINSFKVFLRRKDILAYHRESYKNFISITQKLMNLPLYDKTARKKLYLEIEETQTIPEKKWLLEQLK